MTLIMAVVAYASVFAQAGPQAPATASPAANPVASKFEDSLVLAEPVDDRGPGAMTHRPIPWPSSTR
jgi:hypothetical protein